MIEVPAKFWRHKVASKYTIPEYYGDDLISILNYGQYGNFLYKTKMNCKDNSQREYIIIYEDSLHIVELEKDLKLSDTLDTVIKEEIISIILKYWDYFVKVGLWIKSNHDLSLPTTQ